MNRFFRDTLILSLLMLGVACGSKSDEAQEAPQEAPRHILYGIDATDYRLEQGEVESGETLGKILNRYGVSAVEIDRLDREASDIWPLRNIRAGHRYTAFIHEDSLHSSHLDYLAYERNTSQYVVFGFHNHEGERDSVSITLGEREFTLKRQKRSAVIESSLWQAMVDGDMPYSLAAEVEDIYQWTISFFSVQKGDSFTVIYDEKLIDTVSVGIGRIWGVKFSHYGKDYYAIPFRQNKRVEYWEADGQSLRKQLLKAPLKYSRISSKFSYSRLHPVHKVRRPHTGVDFAAPKGTPVVSVADGVVIFKGWGGGGGNTLKIKHAGGYTTGYLHLNGFAKGIKQGTHVSQGQLIGYVGSTGTSTGPHLDYRVWKGKTPIDPLKIPQEPSEPIKEENKAAFEYVKAKVMAELDGEVSEEERLTLRDTVAFDAAKPTVPAQSEPQPDQE
ncbi:MAG: metalloendopeptidase [Rikenellaceae bacterium]|nr:metalloendopeptidase [Rikenellaceae bacterium]